MKRTAHGSAVRWLWSSSHSGRRGIALLTGVQVLLGFFAVAFAWLLRQTIDAAAAGDGERFRGFCAGLICVVILQLALRALKRFLDEHTRSRLENALKRCLFGVLLDREYPAVTAVHSEEWMNRLTADTAAAADGMTTLLPEAVGMAVRLVGALVMVFALIPRLGVLLVMGTAVMLLVAAALRSTLRKQQKQVREADGIVRVTLSEQLRSLLTVRVFTAEKEAAETAQKAMDGHHGARMRWNAVSNLSTTGLGTVIHGFYLAAVVLCGYGLLDGTVTYGSFAAVLQLVGLIQAPLANGSALVPKFSAMTVSARRLMEAETLPSTRNADALELPQIQAYYNNEFSALCMNGVTFRYPSEREGGKSDAVLQDLDITLPQGAFVVLTGASGAGKSTLLKLLMGIYTPESGRCCLTRRDGAKSVLTGEYTRLFAYVPQGNLLTQGSVREILTLGYPEKRIDDDALWDALALCCADGFVRQLADGLDAELGEHGSGLSEGQLQRLAIARAVCSDRPILILDEATAALDADTEQRILENIRALEERTVLAVTHRDAARYLCDMEYRMDGTGRAVRMR